MSEIELVHQAEMVGDQPIDSVEAVIWCEQRADWLDENSVRVADELRFTAARIMHEQVEIEGTETQQSLADKIGKVQQHVSCCIRVHKIILDYPDSKERSWNSLYQEVNKPKLPRRDKKRESFEEALALVFREVDQMRQAEPAHLIDKYPDKAGRWRESIQRLATEIDQLWKEVNHDHG